MPSGGKAGRVARVVAVHTNTRAKKGLCVVSVIGIVVGLFLTLLILIPVTIKTSVGYGTSDHGQSTCRRKGVWTVKPIGPHVEHVRRQTEHEKSQVEHARLQIEHGQEIVRSTSSFGSVHVRPEKKSSGPGGGNHIRLRKRAVSIPVVKPYVSDVKRAAPSPSLHKPYAHSGEKSCLDEIKVIGREIIVKPA